MTNKLITILLPLIFSLILFVFILLLSTDLFAQIASFIFLLMVLAATLFAIKFRSKLRRFSDSLELDCNADTESVLSEIDRLKESKTSMINELQKKYNREQIIAKRREALLNKIPEGLLSVDSTHRIIFINEAMTKWFGVENSSIGSTVEPILEKLGIPSENRAKFNFGNEIYQEFISVNADETFFFFRNVTESEELSKKLLNSERLASVGEMATRISHEIRNPLSTVKLNSHYIMENLENLPNKDFANLMGLIVEEVERLEEITNKYMGMVRYQKHENAVETVSLPADLLQFLSFQLPELQKRNIELTIGKCDPVTANIPLSSFKEIILNLLKNAWEELEENGKIAVEFAADDPSAIKIIVNDSGRGVPEAEREAVFKNFYTNKPGGTGIGLSHSRKLATEAGGKLFVTDSPLGGAAFVLQIPLKKG
ncbi:PAS domain-containing protein [bacterium]|nr:PAS domain-containing protein [bacterium]